MINYCGLRLGLLSLLLWLTGTMAVQAQDFKITKFEENLLDLTAARADVKDNNGDPCALIKFSVRDLDFEYEPNMGVVKKEQHVGETWLFVPSGTKRLTIRHPQLGILRDYVIPVSIEKKVVYEAELQITDEEYLRAKRQSERDFHLDLGVSFNVMSIMGPAAYLGLNYKNHSLEGGVVFGLSKVKNVSIYQTDNAAYYGTYDYSVMRFFFRYGYDIEASSALLITPLVGAAINNISGSEVKRGTRDLFSKCNTVSATIGCRFSYQIGKMIRVQITPEYDFGVKKDKSFDVLGDTDSTIKSWTDGLNINAGLTFHF